MTRPSALDKGVSVPIPMALIMFPGSNKPIDLTMNMSLLFSHTK